jgi:hypothetical protein
MIWTTFLRNHRDVIAALTFDPSVLTLVPEPRLGGSLIVLWALRGRV